MGSSKQEENSTVEEMLVVYWRGRRMKEGERDRERTIERGRDSFMEVRYGKCGGKILDRGRLWIAIEGE
jgi:hypothetical protein